MFKRAPVAFLCTRMSRDFARRVRGPSAPDRAILALFSSWVARLVMHPTALHWTSTLGESICRISGVRPPNCTIRTLFSAAKGVSETQCLQHSVPRHTIDGEVAESCTGRPLNFDIGILQEKQNRLKRVPVNLPHIYDGCLSVMLRQRRIWSSMHGNEPLSVISANVRLALR